jgi:heme-degrading monooxygenase HmoA
MLVVIADIKLKEGVEEEFKKWFSESNKILSKLDGFVSRRLLESPDGSHRIILEHQSRQTFEAMHQSQEHSKLHSEAITFMESTPIPKLYNIVSS